MTSRKFSRKRIGQVLGLLALSLVMLVAGYSAAATNGEHLDSETPGSRFLVVFSPSYNEGIKQQEVGVVAGRAVDHNYRPMYLLNVAAKKEAPPAGYDGYIDATAGNFKDILTGDFVKPGILFVSSHGNENLLLVEAQPGRDACENQVNEYVRRGVFADGELGCGQGLTGDWGITITGAAIKKYFKDNNTIVHISACESWSLADDFAAARDFFGAKGCPSGNELLRATQSLWGRLHGEIESGRMRPTTVAGRGLGFLQHQHRANTLDTVLSPAVRQHSPKKDESFVVPLNVEGSVNFDTRMDTTVDPATVISVEGCDARIQDPKWVPPFELKFTLQLNTEGEATLTVHQAAARAERTFQNNLDGNTEWRDGWGDLQKSTEGGEDHIGPNRDDFKWKVKCGKGQGSGTSFVLPPVLVGPGGSCKAKTPQLGSIQISEIWATLTNCNTGQPLPQGTQVTFTVNLKPGKEKAEHISDIESITVSAPGFEPTTVQGPFTAIKISIPGPSPITFQVINIGTVCLKPK